MTSRKKEKKPELTEEEKFKLELAADVSTYLNIHKAAYFGHAKNVEKLLDSKVAADTYETETGMTPLILACSNGHVNVAQVLVEKGNANVNLAGHGGLTALHHACKNDHVDVVRYLLSDGVNADVSIDDDVGNTAATFSARVGALKCLELLLSKGATMDATNKRGCTPFLTAVLNGRMAVVDWALRAKNININQTDAEGNTALHYAAQCGYLRMVEQLLSSGAKVTIENSGGDKPHELAASKLIKQVIVTAGRGTIPDTDE